MAIRFYNTLTRQKEVFEPLNPGEIRMYTCGPTVYNYAHIGNLRSYLFADLLKRHLKYRGFRVFHVMNITDVEDKIIRSCVESGESLDALTERYTQAFWEDLETLGLEPADEYPRATHHIDDIVALIKTLQEKGCTYTHEGSVYYRLRSFSDYGKLSHHRLEGLESGASGRVQKDEYGIEDARDFALWKAYDEADGPISWDTDLGRGRPGWHIECSCMSMRYLGESFDIHTGGVDLVFPHHENEIAQSEAATGQPFVRYWMHNAHLLVEGRKMAKSYGNTYTLRDLVDMGYNPIAIRYVLIATHYRQPNNFTFDAVEAAAESLARIRDFRLRLQETHGEGSDLSEAIASHEKAFGEALDDDLNISAALAAAFEFIRVVNRRLDTGEVGEEGARNANALLDRFHRVTGLFPAAEEQSAPDEVLTLVQERQEARRAKDFARADAIRDKLLAMGWAVEDTPDGPRVKRLLERHA